MATNFLFSLIPLTPAPKCDPASEPKVKLEKLVRQGGAGPEWHSLACQEINAICEEIGLSGHELCRELFLFDEMPLSRESLQSYKQGNVLGQDAYACLLRRLRSFLAIRRAKYGRLMSAGAVEIIEGWMLALSIDVNDTKRSPWKQFSQLIGRVRRNGKIVKVDHTTIYRWYKSNKKPASMSDLIWYDEVVKSAAQKHGPTKSVSVT